MKISRALIPAIAVGALLLTGCTGGGATKDAAGDDCLASGSVSDAITVEGTVGEDLTLTSKDLGKVETRERTVLTEGEGDVAKDGDKLNVALSMFNAANGKEIQHQPEAEIAFGKDMLNEWAYDAMRCGTNGQQVALALPYADMFGEAPAEQTGIEDLSDGDSIVAVLAFGETVEGDASAETSGEPGTLEPGDLLEKAEGKAVDTPKGFPKVKVKLDDKGEPKITIPKGQDAPEELKVATLIEGDGEEVKEGDRVYVNYRGVIWRTGDEFDSSWSRGAPTDFITSQVIGGFTEALVGQKVGSQVISIVPAEDGGYGAAGLEQMGHKPDDVMVFVLDILGTVHAE